MLMKIVLDESITYRLAYIQSASLWLIIIGNFPPLDIGFWLIKFTKSHTSSHTYNKQGLYPLSYVPNIDI